MMRKDESAVSELIGYTVLVAVVSIAAVGLLAGGMGALSASEKQVEYEGASSSLRGLGCLIATMVETNNTFFAAYEMGVPPGYCLAVKDKHDDFRSIGIYRDNERLAFLPLGSVGLRSPFRTVTFEGGAVITNDTGLVGNELHPEIRIVSINGSGHALYMSVIAIVSDTFAEDRSKSTLLIRCISVEPMTWHVPEGSTVTISVASGGVQAWMEQLEACGFDVRLDDGRAEATSRAISEIYVTYSEVEVTHDRG